MSSPVWIDCGSVADVGSPEDLAEQAKPGSHVVLRFGSLSPEEKTALIGRLSAALPDHSVFDSGGDASCRWITVMSVVPRAWVLERRAAVLRAVEEYRRICAELAEKYQASIRRREQVSFLRRICAVLAEKYQAATLSREWRMGEHGGHCRFKNRRTGQVVEVPVREWVDPKRIDPYFFAEFVKTTAGLESVAELITDYFHDGARILEIVEANQPCE
jgi:hypothetical protein